MVHFSAGLRWCTFAWTLGAFFSWIPQLPLRALRQSPELRFDSLQGSIERAVHPKGCRFPLPRDKSPLRYPQLPCQLLAAFAGGRPGGERPGRRGHGQGGGPCVPGAFWAAPGRLRARSLPGATGPGSGGAVGMDSGAGHGRVPLGTEVETCQLL